MLNAEENVLEALVGLLAGFGQVLEQVWRVLMSCQDGYWELSENELGASLSLQLPVGAKVGGEQLKRRLKDVVG